MNGFSKVTEVQKNALRFVIFFVAIGVMMVFLAPLLAEKAEAMTTGEAERSYKIQWSNIKSNLYQGKWVTHPHFWHGDLLIRWATTGSGVFGGTEYGSVEADLLQKPSAIAYKAHVKMSWYNPSRGDNSCGIEITGSDAWTFRGTCTIEQGAFAHADFRVMSRFS